MGDREPTDHLKHHEQLIQECLEELRELGITTKPRVTMLPEAKLYWDDEGEFKE